MTLASLSCLPTFVDSPPFSQRERRKGKWGVSSRRLTEGPACIRFPVEAVGSPASRQRASLGAGPCLACGVSSAPKLRQKQALVVFDGRTEGFLLTGLRRGSVDSPKDSPVQVRDLPPAQDQCHGGPRGIGAWKIVPSIKTL